MSLPLLGSLSQVPVREIWKDEALDFTTWLARSENLALLAETIEIDLVDARAEVPVGSFRVDILAEDESGRRVVIENQLEQTNHDHLGKIITYAAGLGAKVIIWIVPAVRDEHEEAINWLNENTTADAAFFLIQLEAWRIGDSLPAARFNVISRPNDWAKTTKAAASDSLSEIKLEQRAFFEQLRDYGKEHAPHVKSWQTPLPQHWYNVSIGKAGVNMEVRADSQKGFVATGVYIQDDKQLWEKLHEQRLQIEAELGFPLTWENQAERKYSRLGVYHHGDFRDPAMAPELVRKAAASIDAYARVIPKYLV